MMVGPACWPHHDLIIVTHGAVLFSFGKRSLKVEAGDACLIPPNNRFRGLAGRDGATIWVQHFRLETPKSYPNLSNLHRKQAARLPGVARGEWMQGLMHRASQLQSGPKTTTSRRITRLLLTVMFEEFELFLTRDTATSNHAYDRVHKTMEWAALQGSPFPTIAKMARHAGWSLNHFRQTFQAATGRPVGTFLRAQNMKEAERLLRETDHPTKEIARNVGYSDVISFHHAFRRHFKTTPAQYRKQFSTIV